MDDEPKRSSVVEITAHDYYLRGVFHGYFGKDGVIDGALVENVSGTVERHDLSHKTMKFVDVHPELRNIAPGNSS